MTQEINRVHLTSNTLKLKYNFTASLPEIGGNILPLRAGNFLLVLNAFCELHSSAASVQCS